MRHFKRVSCVTLIFAFLVNSATAAILVGPPEAPTGIDGLSITYSGGTKLFDVRFDEQCFNHAVTSVPDPTTVIPFLTSADSHLALTAVDGFLNGLGVAGVAAVGPYNGVLKTNLFYMYGGFTSTHWKNRVWHVLDGSWGHGSNFTDGSPNYLRSSEMTSFGSANAFAVFTTESAPISNPAPGAVLLVGIGTCMMGWMRRKLAL